MNGNNKDKWLHGAIPALGIHLSIGSVYAWSVFVRPITEYLNCSEAKVQVAFSLAIFFLGMSAAFGGAIVEKNVKRSSLLSMLCFVSGLWVTALAVYFKSLWGIYLGYGCLMGIGLGIGYISPVKTLMMWFYNQKGLATGIAITGFGFASTIAGPLITFLNTHFSVPVALALLGLVYIAPMSLAIKLIKKPYDDTYSLGKEQEIKFRYSKILTNKLFILIWLMIFLNIHCGLSLISIASQMLVEINATEAIAAIAVGIMGIFNGAGRLLFSAASDKLKQRSNIYLIIFGLSVLSVAGSILSGNNAIAIAVMLCVISATYGAGFSNLPTLLADIFGMRNISKIHGLSLTAWAIAGMTGNQMSTFIKGQTGSYLYVLYVLIVLFSFGFFISAYILKNRKNSPSPPQA